MPQVCITHSTSIWYIMVTFTRFCTIEHKGGHCGDTHRLKKHRQRREAAGKRSSLSDLRLSPLPYDEWFCLSVNILEKSNWIGRRFAQESGRTTIRSYDIKPLQPGLAHSGTVKNSAMVIKTDLSKFKKNKKETTHRLTYSLSPRQMKITWK